MHGNSTDEQHTYYNFHTEVQYAANDYINLCLYNYPDNYNQTAIRFGGQSYYPVTTAQWFIPLTS
eukprot:4480093-Amphidinium_carterae.1